MTAECGLLPATDALLAITACVDVGEVGFPYRYR